MAITVKQPIGSILYYIKGTSIYSGILCGLASQADILAEDWKIYPN